MTVGTMCQNTTNIMIDDLVPEFLKFISKPSHLTSACLVNKTFHQCASRLLYRHIGMYAYKKHATHNVRLLFATLSRSPNLASFVRSLNIHVFLKCIIDPDPCLSDVVSAIENCINLQRCAWTRDGTLNAEVLTALSSCPDLRELEINGRNDHPDILLKFTKLQSMSIILPNSQVVSLLPTWIALNRDNLTSLALFSHVSFLPSFVLYFSV